MINKKIIKSITPVGAGLVSAQDQQRFALNNVGAQCYATQKGITQTNAGALSVRNTCRECPITPIKGITLIALVITIIILLILAGVTISLTIGENGIFKTAIEAGESYKKSQAEEKARDSSASII